MRLWKNSYVIAGAIIFIFLFGMGIWLEFGWRDSLIAASALTVVAVIVEWLRRNFGWEL